MCRGPQLLYYWRTHNDVSAVWCSQNVSKTEAALQPTLLGPANPYKPPFFIAFPRLLPHVSTPESFTLAHLCFPENCSSRDYRSHMVWHVLELQAGCCFCLTRFRLLIFFQKEKIPQMSQGWYCTPVVPMRLAAYKRRL